MTVSDLIRELQAMPQHLPVKVLLREIVKCDELGEYSIELNEGFSVPAYEVRHSGGYVLISGA